MKSFQELVAESWGISKTFKEFVDSPHELRYGSNDIAYDRLLADHKLFENLIENNKLTKEDLKYLLNEIADRGKGYKTLDILCGKYCVALLEYILNEFVLVDKEIVDKFNAMIEKDEREKRWFEVHKIHNIFDFVKYRYDHPNNEKVLKLIEMNRKLYKLNDFDLDDEQKSELIEVVQNNEIARDRLIEIVDNNLESNYNFDSLMSYLKKSERKNLMNI